MTAAVIRADARALPLPDASVDLVITSPPYFALRDYRDGDGSLAGQIGSEATPREYVAALLDCTREWMRVLKSSGSLWVNLGDKYSTGNSGDSGMAKLGEKWAGGGHSDQKAKRRSAPAAGFQPKTLLGLPWRYALGCIDDLGLILRAEVIWAKPNGMPESVTDRVRRSHEHWFHFTREPRYYSAVDEIREPHTRIDPPRRLGTRNQTQRHISATDNAGWKDHLVAHNPLGKLPGSVWEIATQPLKVPAHLDVDHYAAFPPALPMRIIAGWSPAGICTDCGEGRRPIVDRSVTGAAPTRRIPGTGRDPHSRHGQIEAGSTLRGEHTRAIAGYVCACSTPNAPTRPALIVDPFGGTGTTALAARALGRNAISFDLSHDYARLAQWRTTDPGELARVLGKPKPPPVVPGQGDLFTEEVTA